MINPNEDGITHINIYSKGKTEIGQWLSNFSLSPFIHPEDGSFKSIEGYWYWLSSKDNWLRALYGFKAKEYGRKIGAKDWLEDEEFKRKIKLAIITKLETYKKSEEVIYSSLSFTHYYDYDGRIVEPKEGKWLIDFFNSLRIELS